MLQYKTVAMPQETLSGVKIKDVNSLETANKALSPYGQVIQSECKGGWRFVSMETAPATIKRKKGILEVILGWIPVLGNLMFGSKPMYFYPNFIMLIFEKEA